MAERVFLRDIARARANHHAQLDFPVGLDRAFGQHHIIVRTLNAAGGLHENDGLGRNRQAGLGRVVREIQANGDELGHTRDRAAIAGLAFDER